MNGDADRDRGSASVLVLCVGLATVLFGGGLAAVGAAVVARHRAQAAADFGALAGAVDALFGEATACGRAGLLVGANGARMTGCRLDGLDVVVTVEVVPHGPAARLGVATAAARAGPA